MRENFLTKFYAHADVNAVGLGTDAQFFANVFHPFAAAATYGNNTLVADVTLFGCGNDVLVAVLVDVRHGRVEEEINFVLEVIVQVFKHYVVDVGAEMAHFGI